jgi:hypothetical protein
MTISTLAMCAAYDRDGNRWRVIKSPPWSQVPQLEADVFLKPITPQR